MIRWSAFSGSSRRLFSLTNFPSPSSLNLKIFSLIPKNEKVPTASGAFRLSNGTIHRGNLAIIGANRFIWEPKDVKNIERSIAALLEVIRPIPDIIIIGIEKTEPKIAIDLNRFGCTVEISDINTAANTFNALLDDGRRVIGLFSNQIIAKNSNSSIKPSQVAK